jgi:hypothetical protein
MIVMKKMYFILALMCTVHLSFSQYTVTKVIGQVKNKTSGEILKPGSKLSDDDLLAFSSPNDLLRVIVSGKGIYIISPSPKSQKEQNMLVEILKSALHIKSKEGYLSGRAEANEFIPATFDTEAKVNSRHLIANENKYVFDPSVYNVAGGNRFFLQIEYPGSNVIIHPLRVISDTLILYASDFKTPNKDETIKAKYKLGFFSREKGSSETLADINPYVDTTKEMQSIIDIIVKESKGIDKSELQHNCYAEVYEALGKPSDIVFTNIFNKLIAEHAKNK